MVLKYQKLPPINNIHTCDIQAGLHKCTHEGLIIQRTTTTNSSSMQIRPTSVRLVRLNVGLSLYLHRTFCLSLLLSLSLSRNFGLRPKFRLSESLSKITSLFNLSLILDRTLAQQKAKSQSEVAHWIHSCHCRCCFTAVRMREC